jgi:hypothetical protein
VESAHHKTQLGEVAFRFEVTQKTEGSNRTVESGCATSEPGDHANIDAEARAEGLQAWTEFEHVLFYPIGK